VDVDSFSNSNPVTWNHGKLRSGLNTTPLPLDEVSGVPLELFGERKDEIFDESLYEMLAMGLLRSDFQAGAQAQI